MAGTAVMRPKYPRGMLVGAGGEGARSRVWLAAVAVGPLLVAALAPAAQGAQLKPLTGVYKATPSIGSPWEFRVAKATCAPPVRGGNQHKKKGFCLRPVSEPTFNVSCPSGATIFNAGVVVDELLFSAAGKLAWSWTASDDSTGSFHIGVDRHGHATGYYEVNESHFVPASETTEKCPSGRISFTARRG